MLFTKNKFETLQRQTSTTKRQRRQLYTLTEIQASYVYLPAVHCQTNFPSYAIHFEYALHNRTATLLCLKRIKNLEEAYTIGQFASAFLIIAAASTIILWISYFIVYLGDTLMDVIVHMNTVYRERMGLDYDHIEHEPDCPMYRHPQAHAKQQQLNETNP